MRINEFIKHSRAIFNQLCKQKLKYVVGNQSADLDSIVSAVCMSFYLTNDAKNVAKHVYIPVINYEKQLLKNKHECIYLFEQLAVTLEDFVYINELDAEHIDEVVLVDHNELDPKETELNFRDKVTVVVDHHKDSGAFPQAVPRIVDIGTGSNATLVLDLMRNSAVESMIDEALARMILSPIIIDTSNLTNRTGPKDIENVNYIKSRFSSIDVKQLFDILCDYKFNKGNDPNDTFALFAKDYKQYLDNSQRKWGISVVNIPLREWMKQLAPTNKLFKDAKQYMKDNGLYFFSILSAYKTPEGAFKREMMNISDAETLAKIDDTKGATFVESNYLFAEEDDMALVYKFYDVNDLSLTRKHWHPVLEICLNR